MTPGLDMSGGTDGTAAPRTPTRHLFHYTNADAALFGILKTGTLRLSPLESTNDLWESRPTHHPLLTPPGYEELPPGFVAEIWRRLDYHVRANTKVACLTNDFAMPESYIGPSEAFKGWSHLSLWAHYGAGHSGVCLRFDRDALTEALHSSAKGDTQVFAESVNYTLQPSPVPPVDISKVREFGVDACAAMLVRRHHCAIFFEKHRDWASEQEYRLVRMDESALPFDLGIRRALTGVVLGESFPDSRLRPLNELLASYPNVDVRQVSYLNRGMILLPPEAARGIRSSSQALTGTPGAPEGREAPRRGGPLSQRIEALANEGQPTSVNPPA